ncbi:hypothetical protein [Kaistia sp. MMO-174]|uniref:hypothetical protein n=1 Tax=Kaistia sp. MMO-174 TaxID=3081256 RepID=UPI00301B288A
MNTDADFERLAAAPPILPLPWTVDRFRLMGADGAWSEGTVVGWTSGGFGIWARAIENGVVLFCLTHLRTGAALVYFVDLHDAARYADLANTVADWSEMESAEAAATAPWLERWTRTAALTRAIGFHRLVGLPVSVPVPILMLVEMPAPEAAVLS